jgi:glycosyltransferase involved in cell wall biosynthesis
MSIPHIEDYLSKIESPNSGSKNKYCNNAHKNITNKPLVSIITVVKNNEDTIEQTILSVISQDYSHLEYIIIDGCSTDDTAEIIRKYKDKISCWISEKDEGISDAFNKGISVSNGEIIGIINADDWYENNAITAIVETMCRSDAIDIIHGKMRKWTTERDFILVSSDEKLLERDSTVNHPTVFVKKRIYSKIGLFRLDFKLAMDYEWLLRAKINGHTFYYIDKCLANMRSEGISNRQWIDANFEVLKAKNIYLENKIYHVLFFIFQVLKSIMKSLFLAIGLQWLVKYYHSKFSLVSKQ